MLWYCSDKLAFHFGFINTNFRVLALIMKNLRVCNACHNMCKFANVELCFLFLLKVTSLNTTKGTGTHCITRTSFAFGVRNNYFS